MKLEDRKRISEILPKRTAGIRTHALSDRGLLAQCLTTKPRSIPAGGRAPEGEGFVFVKKLSDIQIDLWTDTVKLAMQTI